MALIKCKKCGGEISDKAKKCVHCGYKKNNFIWLIILISALFLLVIVALVGFIAYIVIDSNSYYGTWTQVTDYYEKSDPTRFICRVESRIIIDDVDSIKYTSEVTKGNCNYSEVDTRGVYAYDFDRVEAEFDYYGQDYDVDIFNKKEYLCYNNCSTKKNYFYKSVSEDNVYVEYVNYYDNYEENTPNDYSDNDNNMTDDFIDIGYTQYKELIKEDGKFIIFIGSDSCPYCEKLDDVLEDIAVKYQLRNIYYLEFTLLTEEEQNEIFREMNLEPSIPTLRIYNNGLKDTIVGYRNSTTLIEAFKNANILDNSSL